MNYLGYQEEELKKSGGYETAQEISRQPEVWMKTALKLFEESQQIHTFLKNAFREVDNILLTGAGSSSFIGYSLAKVMFAHLKILTRVAPTTDIVSFPEYYFNYSHPTLVISFARSGESPESYASLELADKYCERCFHLIVTCDGTGALANYQSKNPLMVFVLPAIANDKALAMTASYTSMLLSGLLITFLDEKEFAREQLELSVKVAEKFLKERPGMLKSIAENNFSRAVFLGAGPLFGTAMEASLKLQELTNGQIICKADTFLGFRHGPKVVVDANTLVVYLFTNNKYAFQYEIDLVRSMQKGNRALCQVGIGEKFISEVQIDKQMDVAVNGGPVDECFQPLSYILPGQLMGFFKSMQVGLKPDTPSLNGAISRVVEGVNIYPVEI